MTVSQEEDPFSLARSTARCRWGERLYVLLYVLVVCNNCMYQMYILGVRTSNNLYLLVVETSCMYLLYVVVVCPNCMY